MPPGGASKKKPDSTNTIIKTPTENTEKKRVVKKPVKVVAIVTPQGIEGTFQSEPRRPLIVHLGIRPSDIIFNEERTGDKEPEPYDESLNNVFIGGQEVLHEKSTDTVIETKEHTTEEHTKKEIVRPLPCFMNSNLMVQFNNTTETKKLPSETNIACFWCVHTFAHGPCIIPEREVNGVYNVYGNFCSPECGVAYLLKEGNDPHVRWERMALLHRIYDTEGKGQIFPAPPRESLALFGGPMSIDTFRATVSAKKVRVDLHMPPMVSILGSIDTKPIDFFDTSSKNMGVWRLRLNPIQRMDCD